MKKTLLAKALSITEKKWVKITKEDTDLVFAHLCGRVTIPKIQKIKGFPKGNSIYSYMLRALREGVRRGDIFKKIYLKKYKKL